MKKQIIIAIILTLLPSHFVLSENRPVIKEERLRGRRIVMIVAESMFNDNELKIPKEIFEKEGAKVIIASTTTTKARGMVRGSSLLLTLVAK